MLFNRHWRLLAFPFPRDTQAVKMASPQEKAFRVIQFTQINAGISTQHEFRKTIQEGPTTMRV